MNVAWVTSSGRSSRVIPAGEKNTDVASLARPVRPVSAGPISPKAVYGDSTANAAAARQMTSLKPFADPRGTGFANPIVFVSPSWLIKSAPRAVSAIR